MGDKPRVPAGAILGAASAAVLLGLIVWRFLPSEGAGRGGRGPTPVEVAPLERGSIELHQTYSGTVEALADFLVAAKVPGRIRSLGVDIGDVVERGQVVAVMDDDEYVQAVAIAEAEVAMAEANLMQARTDLELARREVERTTALRDRGITSEAQFDTSTTNLEAKRAMLAVAEAQLNRAKAALQEAEIQLGFTRVTVDWEGEDATRVVAARFEDAGQLVTASDPIFRVVDLDPLVAVIFVTERDYGLLNVGQPVSLVTDAYPRRRFTGEVRRIAPVFDENSRQARVELAFANRDGMLKPGLFGRATITLAAKSEVVVAPLASLTRRNDEDGVFLLSEGSDEVRWQTVEVGIVAGDTVELRNIEAGGAVVTLGQQLLSDGTTVVVPDVSSNGLTERLADR